MNTYLSSYIRNERKTRWETFETGVDIRLYKTSVPFFRYAFFRSPLLKPFDCEVDPLNLLRNSINSDFKKKHISIRKDDLEENNTVRRNVNRILRKAYSFDAEKESGRKRENEELNQCLFILFSVLCLGVGFN